nr:chloride channel protein [Fusobacteriaceae bacterium]
EIYWYDWIFKLLASVMSLGVGYQGGEVTPLFSIGASLGFLMGSLFKISIPFLVVLGYCTVFGVASNLLITALVLGVEVFGYSISGYLAVIMLLAHFIRKRLFKI